MDELVDILDSEGNPTGEVKLKSEAHRLGLFHPTIHVWCYSKDGKILLQQRGRNKKSFPLKWDVSVAGHVGAGETIKLAAYREVKEEIGKSIRTNMLQKLAVFKTEHRHTEDFIDREFNHTFLYRLDSDTKLTKQTSEVEALKWMTLDGFEKMVKADSTELVPNSLGRYEKVINAIRSLL